jgi:bacteriochlorophyll 4-vinyl reductase
MIEGGVGRLLVASLHQGIADLMPTRLEFYESWLNPRGLRDGRIGLAPLNAVLSFLRQEGESYRLIAARAGEYTADWTVVEQPRLERWLIRRLPPAVRQRVVLRLARKMVRRTYGGSRAIVRWRSGAATVDIRGSIFCKVRERADHPLCEYYVSAIHRLMALFNLEADVATEGCRATGAPQCLILIRPVR